MSRKVFGIPSWLPDAEPDRTKRKERINHLFKQLNDLWPDIDILVIAQNWQDFEPIKTKNKQIVKKYNPLGILGARQVLRKEFLTLDYDYIIMLDDDAKIVSNNNAHIKYMQEIDRHKDGFCFIQAETKANGFDSYVSAQLNLCAISKYIYQSQPFPDIDPQKNEGFEDSIYACLLHYKYHTHEFIPPKGIRCTQFGDVSVPSTWACSTKRPWNLLTNNTNRIKKYIRDYGDLPKNYKSMIVKEIEPPKKLADGKLGSYLYF